MSVSRVRFPRLVGPSAALWLSLWLSLWLGCTPSPSAVSFRVAVVGEDPFLGADSILVRVVGPDGLSVLEDQLDPSERSVVLGPLPFATELSIVVETRLGALPLAGGRSFPFTVPGPGASATREPDVTLGLLGRHASILTVPSGAPVVAIAATASGALLATETELFALALHGSDGRPALGPAIALPASRVGATFTPLAGGLLAVGGAAAGATLLSADGSIAAEVSASDLAARTGAAVAMLDSRTALVVGGFDAAGARLADVVRLERTATGLDVVALEPLGVARAGARAVALRAMSASGEVPRVLLVDGSTALGDADELWVIDPDGVAPLISWLPPAVQRGAALAAVATGEVLLAGGRDASGVVVSDVRVLFVHADRPLAFVSPAPDLLFRARAGATALAFAPAVALVLGGLDPSGLPIDATELADLRSLPGSVRLTGSLPTPAMTTAAAVLDDRSILVASGDALTLYFPYPL